MRVYAGLGAAYLVCPRLLELDERHRHHPEVRPACWRGHTCWRDHDHGEVLEDPEGHTTAVFLWPPGASHVEDHPEAVCLCGLRLVHGDGDNPFTAETVETEGLENGG